MIECLHIIPHFFVDRIFEKFPFKAPVFIPFVHLAEILSHKQKLLSRVSHHKSVSRSQICKFLFLRISRHFSGHGAFSMHHLIVRKYQHKFLAVGIKHAEGQLSVMLISEIWITMHIIKEIIHPPHIPFVVKAKAAV